ncbi:MAG: hypothetical protein QOK31_2018 [Solirubrobacteraceae bacterium]|nr:hypothetical protein [Solirubrobacteraceae bacterium]
MEYEDKITIDTPEGVELELVLAGAGSRAIAALLDFLIKGLVFLAVLLLAWAVGVRDGVGVALLIILSFSLLFGYDVLFEVLASGRTPGKRWSGLRVVLEGGRPIGVGTSLVRNIMRVIDILPGVYTVGLITVVLTARNQRLGDLAAGSLVVRERREFDTTESMPGLPPPAEVAAWDVSAVTPDELAAVREFLARRGGIEARARDRVARQLADRLRSKVGGAASDLGAEAFLEVLYAAKVGGRVGA